MEGSNIELNPPVQSSNFVAVILEASFVITVDIQYVHEKSSALIVFVRLNLLVGHSHMARHLHFKLALILRSRRTKYVSSCRSWL